MTDTFSWHNTFVLYHEKKEIEKQVYGLIKLDMPNKLLLVFIQKMASLIAPSFLHIQKLIKNTKV